MLIDILFSSTDPHRCHDCVRSFAAKEFLSKHVRVHNVKQERFPEVEFDPANIPLGRLGCAHCGTHFGYRAHL